MTTSISKSLQQAVIQWENDCLTVTNGKFTRKWRLTNRGLATELLQHGEETWVDTTPKENACDWFLFHLVTPETQAELEDVRIETAENPPLTAPHVAATVEFVYPEKQLAVRYLVQAFPSAEGVRTQLSVKALKPCGPDDIPSYLLESYAETLPLNPVNLDRHAIGYYNDPQHRNHDDTPMLRSEKRAGDLAQQKREVYDWANILCLNNNSDGLILVKESHKCVNQNGIDTGAFVLTQDGIKVTGLGLKANNYDKTKIWLRHEHYRWCWANWCIPYSGGEADKQLAIKRFDRARFQPHPEQDVHSRSNTWGSCKPGPDARAAAEQNTVLKEIESCADLGIDAVAIDDGWQCPPAGASAADTEDWTPDPERFPNGWNVIREAAEKAGVELNLWLPGAWVTLEQMIRNIEEGGFTGLKIDFLGFRTRDILDTVMDKIERVVRHTDYNLNISWDVTEEASRLGYYFGREYGVLHTSNRKGTFDTDRVHHIAYTPRLALRDAWHLSHYLNLNQIEIPVQDVDKIDPRISNASSYSHAYCTAMSIVGLPLFFQETHFLKGKGRDETRTVMKTWLNHRQSMAKGYVFPIGDEPCDEAWTGFQIHNPETEDGYLLVFRELEAPEAKADLTLQFLEGKSLTCQNVLAGEEWTVKDGSRLTCQIPDAPGFKWIRYRTDRSVRGG